MADVMVVQGRQVGAADIEWLRGLLAASGRAPASSLRRRGSIHTYACTTRLVNPAWRKLDGQDRSIAARLTRVRADFAPHSLQAHPKSPKQAVRYEHKQGERPTGIQEPAPPIPAPISLCFTDH